MRETFHSSLEMGRLVLRGLGLSEAQASARIERFRHHDEAMLHELHKVASDEDARLRTVHAFYDDLEQLFSSNLQDKPILPGEPAAHHDETRPALNAHGTTEIRRIYHLDRGYERLDRKLNSVGAHVERVKGDL